eukprot:CAMPEP_0184402752 /NCGR_PEP_ID=MMETSP0007-20130409/84141_1 /TAXON_ID=97485 /ORGANISM="Prymnesium parvum, Strain Texoma1" /LENGTH=86 /DNA_ID=CAMNT_0026758677 /DNA_START=202 /DNA_END=463 /DNA_ORIENTATION=-
MNVHLSMGTNVVQSGRQAAAAGMLYYLVGARAVASVQMSVMKVTLKTPDTSAYSRAISGNAPDIRWSDAKRCSALSLRRRPLPGNP